MKTLGFPSGTQQRAALLTIGFICICVAIVVSDSLMTRISDLESSVEEVRSTAEEAKTGTEELGSRVDDVENSIESLQFQREFK